VDAIAQRDAIRTVQLVHDYNGKNIKRTRSLPKAQELGESVRAHHHTVGASRWVIRAGTRPPPLFHFPDGHDLDLLVDRRGRMRGILQLLFAETNCLDALG
jgi:hypothetical protein